MSRKTKRNIIIISLTVLFVCLTGLTAYLMNRPPTDYYSPKYDIETTDKNTSDNTKTASIANQNNDKDKYTETNQISEQVPASQSGSISVSDLSQENGFINVMASTSNFSVEKCVYQFNSEGARPVTRETQGTCSGVSIPQVEFEKIGKYTLTVTAYDAQSKISTAKEIDIK